MSTVQQFHMRWAFFWPNSHRYGVWSQSSPFPNEQAANQDLTGLVRAEIHSKPYGGNTSTERVYVCHADDFQEFQWVGQVKKVLGHGAVKSEPDIVGLMIVKKDGSKVAFFKDGTLHNKG